MIAVAGRWSRRWRRTDESFHEQHQPLPRQRLDQPAQIARVEVQPGAQLPEIAPPLADLVQDTRFAEGPIPAEKVVFEGSGSLGDEPVEASNLYYLLILHYLTVVREARGYKAGRAIS